MSTTEDTMKNSAEFSAHLRDRQYRRALNACRNVLANAHPNDGDHEGLCYCKCAIARAWREAEAALEIKAPAPTLSREGKGE